LNIDQFYWHFGFAAFGTGVKVFDPPLIVVLDRIFVGCV